MTTQSIIEESYYTDVEKRLESAGIRLDDFKVSLSDLFDPDECPTAALPFLAQYVGADMYTDILGEAYERLSIREAWYINLHRTTEASVARHSRNLGLGYIIQEIESGTPARVTSVDIIINADATLFNRSDYVDFVTTTYHALLPYLVGLNQVILGSTSSLGFKADARSRTTVATRTV